MLVPSGGWSKYPSLHRHQFESLSLFFVDLLPASEIEIVYMRDVQCICISRHLSCSVLWTGGVMIIALYPAVQGAQRPSVQDQR